MDNQSLIIQIVSLGILLLLCALFASAEAALISLNTLKRHKLIADHKLNARFLEKLYEKPGVMLTTILVGSTLVNIISSIVATFVFLQLLKPFGIRNEALVTTITAIVMTTIILIFGEISPKLVAMKNPERVALRLSPVIWLFSLVMFPLIIILNWITTGVVKVTGGKSLEKGSLVSEEEIRFLISMGLQEGVLAAEEEKMLTSIIEFGDIVVREVMTPRTAIVAVDIKTPLRKVVNIIKRHGHSRIPVYIEKIDSISGFVYAKDLLPYNLDDPENKVELRAIMREAFFVPETKKIDELLREMNKQMQHMAMVVDEYGGISGLVTFEDIIEEIVGEIHDEYDGKEEKMIERAGDNAYLISGILNVADLNRELNLEVPETDDYDSVAGFVVDRLGKIPVKGDSYEDEQIKVTVLGVIKHRITRVRLEVKMQGEEQEDG